MKYLIPALAIFLTFPAACSKPQPEPEPEPVPIHDEMNSVYYWKTVFHLDSADRSFIDRHGIGRIYLRMFDVTVDEFGFSPDDKIRPNASVRVSDDDYVMLRDTLDSLEFIPVVYITLDALKESAGNLSLLASNIVRRVRNMCSYNAIPNVAELQLDCDWTATTEATFFRLCKLVRNSISEFDLPWRLSSTIRLHQLAREAPPLDNGVLMVYNTGSFNNPDADNSIIDQKDVGPYLKHLSSYPLHLDVAYPTYSWQLLFCKRQFQGLLNGLNLKDTARFFRKKENVYTARCDIPYHDRIIRSGDMVREETSDIKNISAVKAQIEKRLAGRPHSNIIYHLDSDNLSKYTSDEIANFLSCEP